VEWAKVRNVGAGAQAVPGQEPGPCSSPPLHRQTERQLRGCHRLHPLVHDEQWRRAAKLLVLYDIVLCQAPLYQYHCERC